MYVFDGTASAGRERERNAETVLRLCVSCLTRHLLLSPLVLRFGTSCRLGHRDVSSGHAGKSTHEQAMRSQHEKEEKQQRGSGKKSE